MTTPELTPTSEPRIFLMTKINRALISYRDVLVLQCLVCGGAVNMLFHKYAMEVRYTPIMKACECKEKV